MIALIAARRLVPGGERDSSRILDVKGLVLLSAGLPLLLYGAFGITLSESNLAAVFALIIGAILAVIFIKIVVFSGA